MTQPRYPGPQYTGPQHYAGPPDPYAQPPYPQPPHGQPPHAPAPAQGSTPRRRRRWPWIVAAVVGLLVVIGSLNRPAPDLAPAASAGTSTDTSTAAPAPAVAAPAPTQAQVAAPAPAAAPKPAPAAAAPAVSPNAITYEVTGDGVRKANNITYIKDANFGQQQANGVGLPWSKTVEIPSGGLGQISSLVAQSGSGGGGSITCRILDSSGREIASSTSEGPYAVVTCSGN